MALGSHLSARVTEREKLLLQKVVAVVRQGEEAFEMVLQQLHELAGGGRQQAPRSAASLQTSGAANAWLVTDVPLRAAVSRRTMRAKDQGPAVPAMDPSTDAPEGDRERRLGSHRYCPHRLRANELIKVKVRGPDGRLRCLRAVEMVEILQEEFPVSRNQALAAVTKAINTLDPDNPSRRVRKKPVYRVFRISEGKGD